MVQSQSGMALGMALFLLNMENRSFLVKFGKLKTFI